MADFLLTGRKTEEWIGRTPDSRPPKAVLDRLFLRQMGRCAITGKKFMASEVKHADHIVPLKDGGANRELNMQLVAEKPHREKTSLENTARAKERRQRLKHQGMWPRSTRPLQSRGFPKRAPQHD
jgi:5-methylcytosine-specific restriction protein A